MGKRKFNITTGIITTKKGNKYIFRNDHGHEKEFWAWNIHDNYDKATVHKWKKLPKHDYVELFDIENPPQTVSFQPLLN